MKRKLNENIKLALTAMFLAGVLASCSKWDEFKKYTANGEIVYTGKLDSVKVLSGDERVKIQGLLPADPKIVKAKVFWNSGADSIEVPIDRSSGSKVFEKILPMTEGIKSFVVYTYDALGNKSVAVDVVGASYGQRYKNALTNRSVGSAVAVSSVTINWLTIDLTAGPMVTEVKYLSTNGEKVIKVPVSSDATLIADLASTAKTFSYRTLYKPNATSIDTFYTDYKVAAIFKDKDVTSDYLLNTKNPVATIEKGSRWGTPANWIINDAVKNFRQSAGVFYGGVDYWFGGPFIAMEAGWSTDNMATITNGKIYQSPTLPAGTYTFEMDIPDCTSGGEFYTVAAEGETIPNIDGVSNALAFAKTNVKGTNKISFKLTETKKVSIGFVGTLPNKGGGDGTFWRINAVRLKQLLPM